MRDQKSLRFGLVCHTQRQARGRLRKVREVAAAACLVFVVGSAGALAQDAEALRQLEWCKNASRMVSDAHGISASTTSPGYARMAENACSKAIELFGTRQERWEAYFTRGLIYMGKSEHELAIADFTKAIESTSIENWQPYWWRAFCHNMKASFSTGDERVTEKEPITPSRAGGLKGNRQRRLQRILGQELGLHEDGSFSCN
jgi:tetratricopeptide (TPR) repeat protein